MEQEDGANAETSSEDEPAIILHIEQSTFSAAPFDGSVRQTWPAPWTSSVSVH
jgi:hypothetical protein